MPRRRDYSTKKYRNPFFSRKNYSLRKGIFCWLLLLIIFSGLVYFLFFSGVFEIRKIEVLGNQKLTAAEIIDFTNQQSLRRRFFIFKQSNIFLINKTKLQEAILEYFLLEQAEIKRQLPDTLKIEITEKLSSIVWITGNQAYYVDLQGKVASRVDNQQIEQLKTGEQFEIFRHQIIAKNLPIVYDLENRGVVIGQKITSPEIIGNIFELVKKLPSKINYDIAYYQYGGREVTTVTIEGWQIKFSLDSDLDLQLDNLVLLLQKKIKNPKELDYIDLRFGERVFYK